MKAHSANKVVGLEGAGFYIGGVVGATAFAQPSVREDQVPRSVQSEWEGKCWLLQRWVREFQAVANADSAIASNDNIKTEVNKLTDHHLSSKVATRSGDLGLGDLDCSRKPCP
jgi:hypothetical protein